MRLPRNLLLNLLLLITFTHSISAVTLEKLLNDSELTPEKFASYFSRFKFQFRAEVQSPEQFLARRSGDCDDYAILAAKVLGRKGYTPRLLAVRMRREVHVVCYIEETGRYLDYNLRKARVKSVATDGRLRDIADQVAQSFRCSWSSISEFTFEDGMKRLVRTVLDDERRQPHMEVTQGG